MLVPEGGVVKTPQGMPLHQINEAYDATKKGEVARSVLEIGQAEGLPDRREPSNPDRAGHDARRARDRLPGAPRQCGDCPGRPGGVALER
jgi:hypothetical protein